MVEFRGSMRALEAPRALHLVPAIWRGLADVPLAAASLRRRRCPRQWWRGASRKADAATAVPTCAVLPVLLS